VNPGRIAIAPPRGEELAGAAARSDVRSGSDVAMGSSPPRTRSVGPKHGEWRTRIRTGDPWTAILPCLVLLGCAASKPSSAGNPRSWDGEVLAHGALRAVFHEGQTGAVVALDTLLPNADSYAVGALADLSGEVTVIGGTAYLSYPGEENAMRTESTMRTNAAATLLVASKVPAWRGFVTERAIPFEELDEEIARAALGAGMNPDERFPFLMEGNFDDLEWHVIDGRRLTAGGTSHQDHLAAAAKARLDRASATLVGFYSKNDQGVFTHMGAKTHIHCVLDEPLSAGHVDHVDIPAGTTVKFPVVGNEHPNETTHPSGFADRKSPRRQAHENPAK
jgi:acetolactate decarboxylase